MHSESFEALVARINRSAYIPSQQETPTMTFVPAKAKPVAAKAAEKFVFRERKAFGAGTSYPWADWLDGQLYMLKQGEHYPEPEGDMAPKLKATNFASQLKEQLLKRGQTGNVQVMDDTTTIAVQATSQPDADAAAAYKLHLKALEKARKARAAAKAAANGDTTETEGEEAE